MKKKVRKRKGDKASGASTAPKKTSQPPEDEAGYGGMDLSNFKKNLGCGG